MGWFIVVFFLVNAEWIDADRLEKEGWSKIAQPSYQECRVKIKEMNTRFEKIAIYREVDLTIKFECECLNNNTNQVNCKPRNWFQKKIYDKYLYN